MALASDRFPMPAFPDGWFQVAYGHEVAAGAVVSLHYFGEQLICYRDSTGEAIVLDAYCPHQGADIGVGGTVEGDCVKCPFHGWLFDRTGANVEIPYARSVNRTARLRRWPTVERAGCIFVWHSAAGGAPAWELPLVPEFDDPGFVWHVPDGARWQIRTHVQEIYENTVDAAHFATVHGVSNFGAVEVTRDGPMFRAVSEVSFATPRGPVPGARSTPNCGDWVSTSCGIADWGRPAPCWRPPRWTVNTSTPVTRSWCSATGTAARAGCHGWGWG